VATKTFSTDSLNAAQDSFEAFTKLSSCKGRRKGPPLPENLNHAETISLVEKKARSSRSPKERNENKGCEKHFPQTMAGHQRSGFSVGLFFRAYSSGAAAAFDAPFELRSGTEGMGNSGRF